MIICNTEKYKNICFDDEYIKQIEEKYHILILYSALRGPQVWGYSNAVSNYNFYAFFTTDNPELKYFRIRDQENNYSLRLYDLQSVLQEMRSYMEHTEKYPSILYRDSSLNEKIKKQGFEERADDKLSYIFEVMYADYIWDSGYLKTHLNELLIQIPVLGLLDYYYSKAYGCLHNIFIHEECKGTKYLETFLGIACMKWMIEQKTVPVMDIFVMMDWCCPNEFQILLKDIIDQQKAIGIEVLKQYENLPDIKKGERDRPKVIVRTNKNFNNWIEKELKVLAIEIAAIGPDARLQIDERQVLYDLQSIESNNSVL